MIKKKSKKSKTSRVRHHPARMSVATPAKKRLVLSYTEEQIRQIKIQAATENKTISDYMFERVIETKPRVKCDFPGCDGKHIPNEETIQAHRDALNDEATEYRSIDDFLSEIGVNKRAKS